MDENLKIIDLLKLLCAIGVVAVHTEPMVAFNSNLWLVSTVYHVLPVPFFFMASGYLLFRKVELPLKCDGKNVLKRYLIKIVRLYIVWTILFLPLIIWGYKNETSAIVVMLKFIRGVFLVGENAYSWPLWYLLGVIVPILLLYTWLSLHISLKKILCFSIVFTVLGEIIKYLHREQMYTSIIDIYYSLFVTTRNGLFIGLIYVVLGMLSFYWKSLSSFFLIGMLMCGCLGCLYNIPFSEFFFAYAFFNLVLKCNFSGVSNAVAVNCRKISTIIYFTHMYWVVFWENLLPHTALYSLHLFLLSCFSSCMLGILFIKYKNNKFFDICFQ